MNECTHMDQVRDVKPHTRGCEECLRMGDTWVHLRLCMSCGHVGCCDSSKNKHATKHFHSVKHPIMKSNRSEEHTSELQSQSNLVCRLLLEKKKNLHSRRPPFCC